MDVVWTARVVELFLQGGAPAGKGAAGLLRVKPVSQPLFPVASNIIRPEAKSTTVTIMLDYYGIICFALA